MASRIFGTGASLLFFLSALFSKTLLNSPAEKISTSAEVAESNGSVGGPSTDLGFLASSLDRLKIKVTDFEAETAPSISEFNDFVVELSPKTPKAEVVTASFVRDASSQTGADLSEALFGDYPLETVKPAKSESKSKKKRSGPAPRETIGSESIQSATTASPLSSNVGTELASSSRNSSNSGSFQRSGGGAGGGFAGGSGLGGGSRNSGGSGGGGASGGGSGGSMPSIGGGGGANRSSQNSVVSSVDQVLSSRNVSVLASDSSNPSSKASAIFSSAFPQLTADGKYGIPNHQYWGFNFDEATNGFAAGSKAAADAQFERYLGQLQSDLLAKDQVVKFSPGELRDTYSSLNNQASQAKTGSFLTFMIIDFPVKGFYIPRSVFNNTYPGNGGSSPVPNDPGVQ